MAQERASARGVVLVDNREASDRLRFPTLVGQGSPTWVPSILSPLRRRPEPSPCKHTYNHQRSHSSIGGRAPITRVTNVPGDYS